MKNAKEVLYQNSMKEKEGQAKRSTLLNDLGDELTPAQILYSSNEDLERMKEKSKNNMPKLGIKEKITEFIEAKIPKKEIKPIKGSLSYYEKGEDVWQSDEKFQTILKNIYGAEGGYSDKKMIEEEKQILELLKKHMMHIIKNMVCL